MKATIAKPIAGKSNGSTNNAPIINQTGCSSGTSVT